MFDITMDAHGIFAALFLCAVVIATIWKVVFGRQPVDFDTDGYTPSEKLGADQHNFRVPPAMQGSRAVNGGPPWTEERFRAAAAPHVALHREVHGDEDGEFDPGITSVLRLLRPEEVVESTRGKHKGEAGADPSDAGDTSHSDAEEFGAETRAFIEFANGTKPDRPGWARGAR